MSKVNYRRLGMWKVRVKIPPNKIIDSAVVYNRHRERNKLRKKLKDYQWEEDYEKNN